MQTLVKVRMLDARCGVLAGEIAEFDPVFARDLVAAKGAEYVTEPKAVPFTERKGRRDKMLRTVGGTT